MHLRLLSVFVICFVINIGSSKSLKNDDEIVLVHVLFRHGARTPIEFYPTDPHSNQTFYPTGRGSLTNNGKLMMFKVGQTLRKKYDSLLGNDYTEDKITVRSTDRSRTKMSASLVLAGMWTPSKTQKWHPSLAWLPIPVIAKSREEEDLLNPGNCKIRGPLLDSLSSNLTLHDTYIKPHKELFEYIARYSGKKVQTLRDILEFHFTLQTETENGLQLPEWANKIYPKTLETIVPQVYEYVNADPVIQSIQSGYLLQKIINDSKLKINGTSSAKDKVMFLYAAHDTNIGGLLHALKVFKREMPDYGSAVIFELHKKDGKHFIKVRHLKHPHSPHIDDLVLPGCEKLCPIEKFAELYDDILPKVGYFELCNKI